MAYTYEDFEREANNAGMMGEFSQYDLDTARLHPEFGLSVLSQKKAYKNATTPEQRALINEETNQLRKSYGAYSGGADGSAFISEGMLPRAITGQLDTLTSQEPFSYSNQNAYQQALSKVTDAPEFSWSLETDPVWPSLKKSYLREGDRATANALGKASAATGGRPSSWAVNAATQAGDYYASQLGDRIPTLYQQAWDRAQQERQNDLAILSALGADRDREYGEYTGETARQRAILSDLEGRDETIYNRNEAEEAQRLAQEEKDQEDARRQVDAILAAGGTPSQELLIKSGYGSEYSAALAAAMARSQGIEDADWKAKYGDYSGLAGLGVDTTYVQALKDAELGKLTPSGGGGGGYYGTPAAPVKLPYLQGSYTARTKEGKGTDKTGETLLTDMLLKWPDKVIYSKSDWDNLTASYDEQALKDAGFRNGTGRNTGRSGSETSSRDYGSGGRSVDTKQKAK